MKKIVIIPQSSGFDARIDVPESTDFKIGDSVYFDCSHTKVLEIKHDLDNMITYFICG